MLITPFSPLRTTGLLLLLLPLTGGCVALSIPSQRDHDPIDHGGIFGDWRGMTGGSKSHTPVHAGTVGDEFVADSCSGDCFGACETCDDYVPAPEPPDIPWPRFHPVPTRPIFGGQAEAEMYAPGG